jgi:hypothetical protein
MPERQRKSKRNLALIVGGVVGAFVLLIGCAGGLTVAVYLLGASRVPAGPSPDKEGEVWSNTELLTHLNSKGMDLTGFSTHFGSSHGPSMFWTDTASAAKYRDKMLGAGWRPSIGEMQFVYVQRVDSAQRAQDEVGAASMPGAVEFTWGRFIFVGTPEMTNQIKKILRVK